MIDSASRLKRPSLGEYRFVLIGSFIALAITSIPYVLGAVMATDERVFGGFVYAVDDCYSYLAKMRQGAEGAWLFHIPYTPEPHPGALLFTFRRLLGKSATILPGSDLTTKMVWVYHIARWVFGTGLLVTIYRFLAALASSIRVRRLAWLLITFGGGLGWLLIALGRAEWLGSLPLDFISPESFTFLVLFAFPHLALAQTLLLWGILAMMTAWRLTDPSTGPTSVKLPFKPGSDRDGIGRVRWPAATLAGLLWLLMGLVVPFYPAVAWAVVGAAWIVLTFRERRLCWREGCAAALAVLISAPMVIYGVWRFASHPVYATWEAQSRTLSPHPLHYAAAYGVPLILGGLAAKDAWHSEKPVWLALTWICLVPVLLYLPINAQRRLAVGVQVPLSLVAAEGLVRLANLGSTGGNLRGKLVIALVLFSLLPSNVMTIVGTTMALRGQPSPVFRDRHEIAAMDWLSERVAPTDAVLTSYETGTYLPARAVARVFVGQGPESVRVEEKRRLVGQFFDVTTEESWRQQLLTEYGVDYVFWGPKERSLGEFDPSEADYLRAVYDKNGYHLFEFIG